MQIIRRGGERRKTTSHTFRLTADTIINVFYILFNTKVLIYIRHLHIKPASSTYHKFLTGEIFFPPVPPLLVCHPIKVMKTLILVVFKLQSMLSTALLQQRKILAINLFMYLYLICLTPSGNSL